MTTTAQSHLAIGILHTVIERQETLRTWAKTVFTGFEMPMFLGLIGQLVFIRHASPDAVSKAIPHQLDTLPFEGCEQGWMQVIIDQLRQRGHNDQAIAEIVSGTASLMIQAQELAEKQAKHEAAYRPRPLPDLSQLFATKLDN